MPTAPVPQGDLRGRHVHFADGRGAQSESNTGKFAENVEADPEESTNLIDDPALQEVAAEMRTKVRRFRMETRDPWVLASRQMGEEGLEGGVS